MKMKQRQKEKPVIPTASMADIIFNLLLFFMVCSVFRSEEGLPITLPRAKTGTDVQTQSIIHIWADRFNRISINDKLVQVPHIQLIMAGQMEKDRATIVAFNIDHRTKYLLVSDIMDQLREANAINVTFTSVYESE